MINSVGVLSHPKIVSTGEVAAQIDATLREWGVTSHRASTWDTDSIASIIGKLDLLVVLGGDGSTLRAARLAAPHNVLVVSINMGRLGFLAELQPDDWRPNLRRIIDGDFWVEERMMLSAEAFRDGQSLGSRLALNDVVISRGTLARMVRVRTMVDGSLFTTYACDGLIVATATGSTAYALAAGGPILPPALKNIVLVPIAPHLSLDKPIVLSQGSVVEMTVSTDHQAILTNDGQNELTLKNSDRVLVQASDCVARFARVQPRHYFYQTMMSRLKTEPCE
ncbi:MAG: NAD(+)/NADH kinase [Chloroflexi bacterium]|nr:NAD(+)/NADH kinase [Chloroflexota bacterium]